MGSKKKKKRLRGVILGSSKFAQVSAHVLAGVRKPAPLAGSSGGVVLSLPPQEATVESASHLPSSTRSDLSLVAASDSVPRSDLKFGSRNSLAPSVEGSSSGKDRAGTSVLVSESLSKLVLEPNLVNTDSVRLTVEGSTSNVVSDKAPPPTAVIDSPSGEAIPPAPRKYSAVARDSSSLEEIGSPTEHILGVPFVFIPDENIQAAKVELKTSSLPNSMVHLQR